MSCYSNAACPTYDFSKAYPPAPKPGADGKTPPTEEEKERQKYYDELNKLEVDVTPTTVAAQCQFFCQEVQKAEAIKCARLREKVALALEKAGCPSNVTAKSNGTGGCAPCQGTSIPAWVPPYISMSSSNSNAATAGSCSSGYCTKPAAPQY